MNRSSSVTTILVVVGCLLAGASPSSAQGPYYAVPAWDQKLPTNTRFVLVFFEEVCVNNLCGQVARGVLDRETGLVWERSPSSTLNVWREALRQCADTVHANRMGWRLPTVDELTSLLDPSIVSGARLPPGHPFLNVSSGSFYWTATQSGITISDPALGSFHYVIDLDTPGVGSVSDSQDHFAWCVRGGAK